MKARDRVLMLVTANPGLKMTELAADRELALSGVDIQELVDEMLVEGELKCIEYTLPSSAYRLRTLLFAPDVKLYFKQYTHFLLRSALPRIESKMTRDEWLVLAYGQVDVIGRDIDRVAEAEPFMGEEERKQAVILMTQYNKALEFLGYAVRVVNSQNLMSELAQVN